MRTMFMLFMLQVALAVAPAVSALQAPRELTEVDRLRLERLALQRQIAELQAEGDACRAILGPLRARVNREELERLEAATIAAIEAAHPGYQLDRQSGRLVAIPSAEPGSAKEPAPNGRN